MDSNDLGTRIWVLLHRCQGKVPGDRVFVVYRPEPLTKCACFEHEWALLRVCISHIGMTMRVCKNVTSRPTVVSIWWAATRHIAMGYAPERADVRDDADYDKQSHFAAWTLVHDQTARCSNTQQPTTVRTVAELQICRLARPTPLRERWGCMAMRMLKDRCPPDGIVKYLCRPCVWYLNSNGFLKNITRLMILLQVLADREYCMPHVIAGSIPLQ